MVSLRAATKWTVQELPIHKEKREHSTGSKVKRKAPTDYKEYRFTLKEEFRCDLEKKKAAAVVSYFF